MGYGKFILYLKSAIMLQAQQDISSIHSSTFHAYSKPDREKHMRHLKETATQFLKKEIKDYREVLKNLAHSLMGRK